MIQVQGAGKHFGGRWIFKGVSLQVKDGESVALIGPSGSGKSLLLKMVAKLVAPDEGSIAVGSDDVGMLFQKNALFDSLTVIENLLFPLKERKGVIGAEARSRSERMLAAVGLAGSEGLYPDEISGGMQKRLGIARALIVEPRVILYDEPTAGLDPITSKTIAELIRKLKAENGGTILCVTNDVQRAYQLGDRICLLAQGRVLEGGSPDAVKATTDPALRQFIYGLKKGPLTSALDEEAPPAPVIEEPRP